MRCKFLLSGACNKFGGSFYGANAGSNFSAIQHSVVPGSIADVSDDVSACGQAQWWYLAGTHEDVKPLTADESKA